MAFPKGSNPGYLAVGPDHNLWVTETGTGRIGRVTAGGQLIEFPLPSARSAPDEIVTGPDGAMWFTEPGVGKIGRITMSGEVTELYISEGQPGGLALGPDNNLWATVGPNPPTVVRVTPSMSYTAFALGTGPGTPTGITAGPDGNLWVGEPYRASIARVTTAGGAIHYLVAQGSYPFAMALGPNKSVWFTDNAHIGMISTSGTVTVFDPPDGNSGLFDLVSGPDGALYYTENIPQRLGRITSSGYATVFAQLPAAPVGVTVGPDGQLWFAMNVADKIGHVSL